MGTQALQRLAGNLYGTGRRQRRNRCGVLLVLLIQACLINYVNMQRETVTTEQILEKKIAITYDDGPNPDYTEMLLEAIKEITGESPEFIRPPFGCWKCNLDYETSMIEVLWDVDPLDWKTSNSDVITKRVVDKVEENDIILLHDASESSVVAAFKIIDALKKQGYTFVTVDEILFD